MSDEPWIDVDGDGHADPVTEIDNPDGSVTYEHFDAQGHLDFVGVSEHGDGHVDYADYDTDHDGHFDERLAASSPHGYLDHQVTGVDFSHDDALAAEHDSGGTGTGTTGSGGAPAGGTTAGGTTAGGHEPAAPAIGEPVGTTGESTAPEYGSTGYEVPPIGSEPDGPGEPSYGVAIGEGISPYGS